ncbi:glutamate--cysteine ligase regulatory subunit-like [Babylonia areolata]|uniref:glutamate--cysteine ligase regulatory subunit-like n=1 Tax=Babylonia areolata TaxID=304850 RepID=UPI003FD66E0A
MADEIPIIPKVSELEVRTGNIVNWNRLKRKPSQNPTVELTECITAAVKKHFDAADKTELQYVRFLECVDLEQQQQQQSLQDERGELKVIIKLFICAEQSPDVVVEAINKVITELDCSFVETVLLSLSMFESEDDIQVEQIKPYWQALEGLVDQKRVFSIGVSDLDKVKLTQLYQLARVKPSINQVNPASCCVVPKDLTEYAKQADIQLQTHNDPPELLPSGQLKDAVRQCGTEQDSVGWSALWVARYSVLVRCRGIIKSKGYVLRALRDPYQPL